MKGATSAMTRNLWKNFRGLFVWIVALITYYASGNPSLGEPWSIPGSFFILVGFGVMTLSVYIYYGGIEAFKEKKKEIPPEPVSVANGSDDEEEDVLAETPSK